MNVPHCMHSKLLISVTNPITGGRRVTFSFTMRFKSLKLKHVTSYAYVCEMGEEGAENLSKLDRTHLFRTNKPDL